MYKCIYSRFFHFLEHGFVPCKTSVYIEQHIIGKYGYPSMTKAILKPISQFSSGLLTAWALHSTPQLIKSKKLSAWTDNEIKEETMSRLLMRRII